MGKFTPAEIEFLGGQRLGRLATVDRRGEPHVVPVGFRYNPELETIDVGGHDVAQTKKFRDVAATGRAAFVVDEVLPPWRPRGVEIRGRAEALPEGGREIHPNFGVSMIRIHPTRIIGWGLDGDGFTRNSRTIE